MWQACASYPDPAVRILHPSFERYRVLLAGVERLATGFRWAEGPVWFGDGRYLLFSDIPNNRIMKWEEETGTTTVFRKPSDYANGHTRDRQGRLVSCEHGTRRVTRTEYDGSITVLAERFEGKRLNSPNDVVVKSDGSIWFSDPAFGLNDYEGFRAQPELPTHLYRIDGATGELTVAARDIASPNGLAFSPDESLLYVVQSRGTPYRNIVAFDVIDGGRALANPRVLIDCGPGGTPDGIRCDEDGNLWCGWGMGPEMDGVMVYSPQGLAIGHIRLPERCANLCFGGPRRNRLFMAGSQSLYALYVNTRGA
ncbi:SMP-30/gluconolactonase/LRE family protein [Xylophilus rhododendri]|uniref:SMP-30/gluconolactonase/LRE family protein n=1 Tax=Xylophilus rhododendri TaxID=2697032 RepID=A0A857JE53_9BURK|nr:SMP-30/gluconolactonase/LRE family protein [Xylophilus rhododendri]QHJ01059.1 SMP-30/gluconolactonase/LRE family protein [Xylophilus rhododendri]